MVDMLSFLAYDPTRHFKLLPYIGKLANEKLRHKKKDFGPLYLNKMFETLATKENTTR